LKALPRETVDLSSLKQNPRNYRKHPADQLAHIIASLKSNGQYRNIVVAKDDTILAGHGVVEAAKQLKWKQLEVVRMSYGPDDTRALKLMTGDNEIGGIAEDDDRILTELLKDIAKHDDLLGTGFDEQQLKALDFNTRPPDALNQIDENQEWVGMPGYEQGSPPIKLVVGFQNEKDRERFAKKIGIKIDMKGGRTWSTRWPWTDRENRAHIRFETTEK
jgi:hypothetical protein